MRYTISFAIASLLGTGMAMAEVPRVVTDIHPVHALVAQVMGDLGSPELLLARGANEHAFQLRPSQAAGLQDADVVFWIGPELTPWLERALQSVPDSVSRVALLDAPGTMTRKYGAQDDHAANGEADQHKDSAAGEGHEHGEEHGDEHTAVESEGHDHGDEHGDEHGEEHGAGESHDHEGVDPHAWLAPENAMNWLQIIAADLSARDPSNAATYAANAKAAAARIAATDAVLHKALAPVADQPIIVFHDAFGYFAAHYGLTIAGAVSDGDAASPGAARMVALRDMIAASGTVCLFPEVQHDPALMAQLAEGTGARIGGALDPVGSSLAPGPALYDALLTGMATTIIDCLSTP